MNVLTANQIPKDDINEFSRKLQTVLGEHRRILAENGFETDMTAIEAWASQLYSGSQSALEALMRTGQKSLIELKERVSHQLEEQQLAAAESPRVSHIGEKKIGKYAEALKDLSDLTDSFLAIVQPPVTHNHKGDVIMELVTPKEDGAKTEIGLRDARRAEIAEALSTMLASTYSLYVKSLFYHWNVTGPQFHSLHELFEQHYENLHEAGDEVAERIRALGHYTPGTLKAFADLSVINDDAELPTAADDMLANLQAAHELCAAEARRVMKIAERADDEVTADLMIERMEFHDKAIWMLSASQA